MYFIFNGKSSEEMNLKIIEFSPPSRAARLNEQITIPRRATPVTILKDNYVKTSISAKFALFDRTKYRDVLSWLSGSGKLIFSDEDNLYYNAFFCEEIQTTRIDNSVFELECKVEFDPFAYSVAEKIIDLTNATSYIEVQNSGSMIAEPIITFTPSESESVTIDTNGLVLNIDIPQEAETIVIDSSLLIIYYITSTNEKVNLMPQTVGDLPLLNIGKNYIKHSGGISAMNININERWL